MAASKDTILVTGANGGLGSAIAHSLVTVSRHVATHHVIYTVRSTVAASTIRSAVKDIESQSYEIVQLDL